MTAQPAEGGGLQVKDETVLRVQRARIASLSHEVDVLQAALIEAYEERERLQGLWDDERRVLTEAADRAQVSRSE